MDEACLDVLIDDSGAFGPEPVVVVCEEPPGHFPGTPHVGSNGWRWAQ